MQLAVKGTVIKLFCDIGKARSEYHDKAFHNLTCKHIQCGEVWPFNYAKQKNVPEDKQDEFGYGDVWTFTALK